MLGERLKEQDPQSRVVEQAGPTSVVYAKKEMAAKLIDERERDRIVFVSPLTPERKLTQPLKVYLGKIGALRPLQDATDRRPGPEPVQRDAPMPLAIVPAGQRPNLLAAGADGIQAFESPQKVNVSFYLFKGRENDDVVQRVTDAGGSVVGRGSGMTFDVVRAEVPASKILDVAASPAVREVTLAPRFIKQNDEAKKILVRNPPMFVPPIDGTGQIVGHADSGLDNGVNNNSMHTAFQGRIKKVFPLGRPAPNNDWSDRGGHGTHTAGSVLGSGHRSPAWPLGPYSCINLSTTRMVTSPGSQRPWGISFNRRSSKGPASIPTAGGSPLS